MTLTPAYLERHQIPYQLVYQEVGTLVITTGFAYHCVWNLGTNLAVSVKVGTVEPRGVGCFCDGGVN